ncbi:MAG: FMN-binding protein [Pirellulaceae bacterium]
MTVSNSKIEDVSITKHQEKQFYAALTDTPRQILERQSVMGIDGTSGATITSQAIVNASARALSQGAK